MSKELVAKVAKIQKELKAPKNQRNTFGKYNYRNQEDILEAVKPLLGDLVMTVNDEIVELGGRAMAAMMSAVIAVRPACVGKAMSSTVSSASSTISLNDSQSSRGENCRGRVTTRANQMPLQAASTGSTKAERLFHPAKSGQRYCPPMPSSPACAAASAAM